MSYPDIGADNFTEDLLSRKEFANLISDFSDDFRNKESDDGFDNYFRVKSHQIFVGNFMNPDTPYKRLHLSWVTGTGKTRGALTFADQFVKVYKKLFIMAQANATSKKAQMDAAAKTPTVFVIGFRGSKEAFVRDLLKYPEFGFISSEERVELLAYQKAAKSGLPEDIKNFTEFFSRLKRRITNKAKGGFYKFYGYEEFASKLFGGDVSLIDLEAIATEKMRTRGQSAEDASLEHIFNEYIRAGKLRVNVSMMKMFENSLIICDEIHQTYNMNMKNNRGVAIQYVLDTVPSVRFLSMSATPINNSATEIVELVNYLVPKEQKITKREFFTNGKISKENLKKIGELMHGRISFLQDTNIKYYPQRIIEGDVVVLPHDVGDMRQGTRVPYLQFIQCHMSDMHINTINSISSEKDRPKLELDVEETADVDSAPVDSASATDIGAGDGSRKLIPTDGYTLFDMVFPSPDSSDIGLYRSSNITTKLFGASQQWRAEKGIEIKKFSSTNNIISGRFLSRANIGAYSAKYATLLDKLMSIISSGGGKIMVYHDRVKMSGVLFIQELLRENCFIDETSEPVDSTLCAQCGKSRESHAGVFQPTTTNADTASISTHQYTPARFMTVHGDMEQHLIASKLSKFNMPSNAFGQEYLVLIGSKIIKESWEVKDVQNMIITSLPVNIPTLIQVFGRCVRRDSHMNLPASQRKVSISILVSTVRPGTPYIDAISPEMYRYIEKLSEYITIQEIEREINRNAVDAIVNRNINMSRDMLKQYFPDGEDKPPVAMLGNLYFTPADDIGDRAKIITNPNLLTFLAYRHSDTEIALVSMIIKRAFIREPAYDYATLWSFVKNPPFSVETNPAMISESNFIIALYGLVSDSIPITTSRRDIVRSVAESLLDVNAKLVYRNGIACKIVPVGDYFVAFPLNMMTVSAVNTSTDPPVEKYRDKDIAFMRENKPSIMKPQVDIETYMRSNSTADTTRINVHKFLKSRKSDDNFQVNLDKFSDAFSGEITHLDAVKFLLEYPVKFHIALINHAVVSLLDKKTPARVAALCNNVVQLFDMFGVIIFAKEMRKYKDVIKQFSLDVPEDDMMPVGYVGRKSVELYDTRDSKWITISKETMNKRVTYKENDIVIGIVDASTEVPKFKLRAPMKGGMMQAETDDMRLIERGMVCFTKSKAELESILSKLGVKISGDGSRIKMLCAAITSELFAREVSERRKNTRIKYVYGWWDETK